MFDNFRAHSITQTIESSKSITHQRETINLLNEKLLEEHIKQGFRYIHLGLIQVAVKPLHKLGLNTPILLVLRDSRIKTFPESIIAIYIYIYIDANYCISNMNQHVINCIYVHDLLICSIIIQ
jgi:hypothetical protein